VSVINFIEVIFKKQSLVFGGYNMPFGRKMQLKLKIWACFRKSHKTTKPYFCLTFTFTSGQNSDLLVNFWLNLHSLLKTFESEKNIVEALQYIFFDDSIVTDQR
jgi:hypothetical protein